MTVTTSAAASIPQAAIQTPITGAPIAGAPVLGADIAGAAKGAASAVSDIAPAATNLVSSATNIAPAAPEITSGIIVDATLWVLIAFSAVTWALILIKAIQHLRISHHNRVYGKKFWGAADFQAASELEGDKGPAAGGDRSGPGG